MHAAIAPNESPLVQPARTQPQTEAVVNEHLESVGAAVRNQVRVVRAGCAEHGNDTRQRRIRAGAHVDRCNGQPHRFNADHRSQSRNRRRPAPAS